MRSFFIGPAAVLLLFVHTAGAATTARDTPFLQDISIQFNTSDELRGARFRKLEVNKDGIAYVLTDRGVARLFEHVLALDRSFRPLAGAIPRDITTSPSGALYYLFEDHWLSNDDAGRPFGKLSRSADGAGLPTQIAVDANGNVGLFAASGGGDIETLLFAANGSESRTRIPGAKGLVAARGNKHEFLVLTGTGVFGFMGTNPPQMRVGLEESPTCFAFRGDDMFVGTTNGYFGFSFKTGKRNLPLQTRLPWPGISSLVATADSIWAGTPRGAFRHHPEGRIDYYASRRWLADDDVIDLKAAHDGSGMFILTRTALNKIEFRSMTLADKAAHYDRKIRERHIRYGFCAELRLKRAGDITSAEMIDTDNDGTWSNYYMASQAFRFGATGDEQARRNAWETFGAFERLLDITGTNDFIARTFERKGFKVSDPDRWRDPPDPRDADWEWKGHTSSDEIIAHTLGSAAMWECVAKTDAERKRIARFYERMINHIIRNNWYLVDADGKPTLWGRWNPEYVNWYPHTIGDRRLNSAELIAMLQFAYRITRDETYRTKGYELLSKHGYLKNIESSMRLIAAPTAGFVFQGNDMGSEWNHSDDLLAFDAYWVLCRFAFTDELRKRYVAAVRDHWEIEKHERNPLWNFVYASTGSKDFDLEGALWTLRNFPLDLRTWRIQNSHRHDITKMPSNFRDQQLAELLPADERQITRWNTQPFILDGGDGGHIEFAGDEFLLPYWMGRYLGAIK